MPSQIDSCQGIRASKSPEKMASAQSTSSSVPSVNPVTFSERFGELATEKGFFVSGAVLTADARQNFLDYVKDGKFPPHITNCHQKAQYRAKVRRNRFCLLEAEPGNSILVVSYDGSMLRVAIDAEIYDVLVMVHCQQLAHAGSKKTWKSLSSKYRFIPKVVVELFIKVGLEFNLSQFFFNSNNSFRSCVQLVHRRGQR